MIAKRSFRGTGRKRHTHDKRGKTVQELGALMWVEECSCGKRRVCSQGCGRATATHCSQWYGIEDFTKIKQAFPEWFKC